MEDNLDRISRGEGESRRYNRVIDIRRFDQDKRDFVSVCRRRRLGRRNKWASFIQSILSDARFSYGYVKGGISA